MWKILVAAILEASYAIFTRTWLRNHAGFIEVELWTSVARVVSLIAYCLLFRDLLLSREANYPPLFHPLLALSIVLVLLVPLLCLWYAYKGIEHGWSRAVLTHHIETQLYKREGKAITNFQRTLPPPRSDLAEQTLKDPYDFDFLMLQSDAHERDLEQGELVESLSKNLKGSVPRPHLLKEQLPSKPSFALCICVFGDHYTEHLQ